MNGVDVNKGLIWLQTATRTKARFKMSHLCAENDYLFALCGQDYIRDQCPDQRVSHRLQNTKKSIYATCDRKSDCWNSGNLKVPWYNVRKGAQLASARWFTLF